MDESVHDEWLNWIKNVHIPAIMATGYFKSFQILSILNSPNEGLTYCVQYHTDSLDKYQAYEQQASTHFKNIHLKQFENKLVLFESIMQVVN